MPDGHVLIVADRERPAVTSGLAFTWLRSVGLDRSTPYRGIAVVKPGDLSAGDVGVYRPVSTRVTPR